MPRLIWLPRLADALPYRDASRTRRRDTRRFGFECLEHRTVPSSVTLTVTSLADTGSGTLRAAIAAVEGGATSDNYVIGFAPGLTGTITLESALPLLTNNVSINGPGAASLTVRRDPNAASSFGIFEFGRVTASVSGLTISGGARGDGGGICNENGSLTVSNCVVSNNAAFDGGGISNGSGTMTVSGCTITGNTGVSNTWGADGGGIDNGGTLKLTNSTLTDNTADFGGGLACNPGSTTTVSGCTVEGNSATDHGGGICCVWDFMGELGTGRLTVQSSTVVNNLYPGFPDDLCNEWPAANDVTLVGCDVGVITFPVTIKKS